MNTLKKIKDYFAKEGFTETQRTDLGGDYIYFIDKTNPAGFDEILVSHIRAGNEDISFILGSDKSNFEELSGIARELKGLIDLALFEIVNKTEITPGWDNNPMTFKHAIKVNLQVNK